MQANPLYVFGTVLSLLLSQEDYVLEALMPETHFFLLLDGDSCTCYLEPLEKMILVYFHFMNRWAPHIHHWNVHPHYWKSEFLDLEVWAQVNFLSAVLGALLIANWGKQSASFSLL